MKVFPGLVALLLLASAVAQEEAAPFDGAYDDFPGDAPMGLDLLAIQWSHDGRVVVDLNGALPADAGLTAIVYVGTEGNPEPDQAFLLHTGPGGDHIQLVQGGEVPAFAVERGNGTVAFAVEATFDASCVFAVARTVTYPVEGMQVEDRIGAFTVAEAWDEGSPCSRPMGAIHDGESAGLPSLGVPALVAGLAAVAVLRRTQRS